MQVEVPRKTSISKAKEADVNEDMKQDGKEKNRTRSGSTAEYVHGKKKTTTMQKTYLEDA